MPRPCKRRRICAEPVCRRFGPAGELPADIREPVTMTLDEFEAVRLIDLMGMTQEECAGQMQVSRTTAQAIYGSARIKLAECLVNGRELVLAGGDYEVCDGRTAGCCHRKGCCHRRETAGQHRSDAGL